MDGNFSCTTRSSINSVENDLGVCLFLVASQACNIKVSSLTVTPPGHHNKSFFPIHSDLWITLADRYYVNSILLFFMREQMLHGYLTLHGYLSNVSGVCYTVIDWMFFALLSYSSIRFQGKTKVTSRANKHRSSFNSKIFLSRTIFVFFVAFFRVWSSRFFIGDQRFSLPS